jgi:hypothetical protein
MEIIAVCSENFKKHTHTDAVTAKGKIFVILQYKVRLITTGEKI